ncbi:MAG: ankyrin repeat domain-containing protein [Candidatus Omnitrophota bacterium]|nr:ankyrin repeat domain-containing protein [Candidatus Omnitrophota bacterium]MDZ4242564.1 ankyrin repeat domain-containing protein [Candidatus Omnitrophota bacterium]
MSKIILSLLLMLLLSCPSFAAEGLTQDLLKAAAQGDIGLIQDHLDRGLDINQQEPGGETLLHSACYYGQLALARFLLDKGADMDIADVQGQKPLHEAALGGNIGIIGLLIDKGADIKEPDGHGLTVVHDAAMEGNMEALNLFLKRDPSLLKMTDKRGATPLHYAASRGNLEAVEKLLAEGADINAKDRCGRTVLDYTGSSSMHSFLGERGAVNNKGGPSAALRMEGDCD